MRRIFLVLFIIAIFFLGGCKPDVQPPAAASKKPGDFFPLTKGSTWQYLGEGNEFASFNREVLFTEDNRSQLREDNGGTVISRIFKVTENEIVQTFLQGESYDDSNLLDQDPNQSIIILKAPLEIGTKWEHADDTREIVDIKATVNTPAGDFEDCIVVKITSPHSTLFEYFKDGVGMVKREFISEDTKVTSTLEQYKINP